MRVSNAVQSRCGCANLWFWRLNHHLIYIIITKVTTELEMCSRTNWTADEDDHLNKLSCLNSKVNQVEIADKMNDQSVEKNRNSKQCCQRFINYSTFADKSKYKSEWTKEELSTLYNQFEKKGASWTKISHHLPGKSENSIKNKFYGNMRKAVRKMNAISRQGNKKLKKKLRFESVLRAIEAVESFKNLSNELKQESLYLRGRILEIVRAGVEEMDVQPTCTLINQLNQFNLRTRSFRSIKQKKSSQQESRNAPQHRQVVTGEVSRNASEDSNEKVKQICDILSTHKISEYNGRQKNSEMRQIKLDSPLNATCANLNMVCEAARVNQIDISGFLGQLNFPLHDEFELF